MLTYAEAAYGITNASTATDLDGYDGWCNKSTAYKAIATNYHKVCLWCDDANDWGTTAVRYKTSDCSSTAATMKQWSRIVQTWGADTSTCQFQWRTLGECYPHVVYPKKTPQERLREIIQSRQAPLLLMSRKPMPLVQDVREIRARETLCRVLGDVKYQKFLKDGFVSVRAKSGLIYQIFPGHGITAVYRDGVQIERLCVVLRGQFPPTDSLIMRYLIILNDENRFRGYAVKHQVIVKQPQKLPDERPLHEIFSELKRKVA